MISVYFNVPSYFFEDCETYEYFYRDDKEVLALLNQLDIDYEPEEQTHLCGRDYWEYGYWGKETDPDGKTFVTVRGSAMVIDKLVTSFEKRSADFLDYWWEETPWFLSDAVDLSDLGASEAAFLDARYGESLDAGLRADLFSDLLVAA